MNGHELHVRGIVHVTATCTCGWTRERLTSRIEARSAHNSHVLLAIARRHTRQEDTGAGCPSFPRCLPA